MRQLIYLIKKLYLYQPLLLKNYDVYTMKLIFIVGGYLKNRITSKLYSYENCSAKNAITMFIGICT